MEFSAQEFQDTQKMLWENNKLYQLTSRAVMCTVLYPETLSITHVMGTCYTHISVADVSALTAARQLSLYYPKVAVLNSANAVSPGGGVMYGEISPEAELCKCTNLYPCLAKNDNLTYFYQYNDEMTPYYTGRIIYSENVTVFRNEGKNSRLLDRWFPVDVITCAAPNVRDQRAKMKKKKLEKLLTDRIKNILTAAELHGVQALVLNAFGCAEYGNSPELIARIFRQLLVEGEFAYSFREIVFAIPIIRSRDKKNLAAFRDCFGITAGNPLMGKKVSVYGDSISTFQDYNPSACKVYYDKERAGRAGLFSVDSTWWMIVLKHFGAQLLVNNSWSGSRVYGNSSSAGCSEWRTKNLHRDGELPDVILIYLGMNDYGYGVPPGEDYFQAAYGHMLWLLKGRYPKAQIYCATICSGMVQGKTVFPEVLNGNAFAAYNEDIRRCAEAYECKLIDLNRMGVQYDTLDGCHPTAMGMQQLAEGWIQALEDLPEKGEKKRSAPEKAVVPVLLGIAAVSLIVLIILIFKMIGLL